jgi:dTDP-4-amino-4,6-dideoxygalactose transaminase
VRDKDTRGKLMKFLNNNKIHITTHFVPLHSSHAGLKFARYVGSMKYTDNSSDILVRLPLFYDMTTYQAKEVVRVIKSFYKNS